MISNEQLNTTEVVKSGTSFRSTMELQNFYRFVSDNGLRREAHLLLSVICQKIAPKKKRGRTKKVLQ